MKKFKLILAMISSLALILCFTACGSEADPADSDLSAWTEGGAIDEITAYVDDVTDENSENFIPLEDRIVVWDMDGTFIPETTAEGGQTSPELQLLKDYAATKMTGDKKAQKILKKVEKTEKIYHETGSVSDSKEEEAYWDAWDDLFDIVLWDYTPDEMIDRFQSVTDEEYEYGLTYKNTAYVPMKQMYDYLKSKGFNIYVCSGADRMAAFTMCDATFSTEEEPFDYAHCIGAYFTWDVDKDGTPIADDYVEENEGPGKIQTIATQIGKAPLMAFTSTIPCQNTTSTGFCLLVSVFGGPH